MCMPGAVDKVQRLIDDAVSKGAQVRQIACTEPVSCGCSNASCPCGYGCASPQLMRLSVKEGGGACAFVDSGSAEATCTCGHGKI
jgi:hypothetical protein